MARADQAKQLINHPLYVEAVTAMRAAMYEEFVSTRLGEPEARHELWQRMQLMEQFQGKFESIVKAGKKGQDTLKLLDSETNTLR